MLHPGELLTSNQLKTTLSRLPNWNDGRKRMNRNNECKSRKIIKTVTLKMELKLVLLISSKSKT